MVTYGAWFESSRGAVRVRFLSPDRGASLACVLLSCLIISFGGGCALPSIEHRTV